MEKHCASPFKNRVLVVERTGYLANLHDDIHGFVHHLDRDKLVGAMEVHATGKDIGTGQSTEAQLCTVG